MGLANLKTIAHLCIMIFIGGIDFENNCSCNVTGQFWTQFSLEFSQVATGNAFYLTDGEDASGAYRNDSFFAKVELPNVNITRLIALVIHRKGKGITLTMLACSQYLELAA